MRLGSRELDLSRTLVVGIVNVTPDSFFAGSRTAALPSGRARMADMAAAGADLLDIGGESTRPGALPVSAAEELARVLPLIEAAAGLGVPVSVDTRRAEVAMAALAAGAVMVNDVSAGGDPEMAAVVAASGAAWVLMDMPHAVGAMAPSQAAGGCPAALEAGLEAVARRLEAAVARAVAGGVPRAQLAVDPGLGFGKSLEQNLAFLRGPGPLARLRLPVFVGPSRKSFIGCLTGAAVEDRLPGTAAAVTAAVLAGVSFVRVHDVAPMRQVVDVAIAIREVGCGPGVRGGG
jgi:dihydropteroate synthase